MPVIHKPDFPGPVNDHLRWQSAEFENLHLLTIQFQDPMFGIGQAGKWQFFPGPVIPEGLGFFRTGDKDLGIQLYVSIVIPAQLRHVRAAEWSEKPPVENHEDVFPARVVGKRDRIAIKIVQSEIGRRRVEFYSGHKVASFFKKGSTIRIFHPA
jgi:hypothetical protein